MNAWKAAFGVCQIEREAQFWAPGRYQITDDLCVWSLSDQETVRFHVTVWQYLPLEQSFVNSEFARCEALK